MIITMIILSASTSVCYGAGSRFTTSQTFKAAVEERGLDEDDTSLIFPPSLLMTKGI
jgi:hypothetical protein